jgi:hypothetical protein
MKHFTVWATVWVTLNLLDGLFTWAIMRTGGVEINPVYSIAGMIGFAVLKTLITVSAVGLTYLYQKPHLLEGLTAGLSIVVIYTGMWLLI